MEILSDLLTWPPYLTFLLFAIPLMIHIWLLRYDYHHFHHMLIIRVNFKKNCTSLPFWKITLGPPSPVCHFLRADKSIATLLCYFRLILPFCRPHPQSPNLPPHPQPIRQTGATFFVNLSHTLMVISFSSFNFCWHGWPLLMSDCHHGCCHLIWWLHKLVILIMMILMMMMMMMRMMMMRRRRRKGATMVT